MTKLSNTYDDDLAYIHDVGFNAFAKKSAPGLLSILRGAGISDGLVVDLGCGSGLWASKLLRTGYDVWAIDISAAMIKIAKGKAHGAHFRQSSYLDLKLPACDAITALGECFNYQVDKRSNKRQLSLFFARVYNALRPGGVFVFDMAGPERARHRKMRHWNAPNWSLLLHTSQSSGQLERRITTFRKIGDTYRRREHIHRLQLYQPSELASQLRSIGFRVRLVRRFGKFPLPAGIYGFVARKPLEAF
jgi:SAM-dependent methyltransferase